MSKEEKISLEGMRKHFESCSKHQEKALFINPDNKDDFLDLIGAPWAKEEKEKPSVVYFHGMKVFISDNVPEGEVWIVKPPRSRKNNKPHKRKVSPLWKTLISCSAS